MKIFEAFEKAVVKLRRKRVSKAIFKHFGGVVGGGKFKGLKLTFKTNTSAGVLGLKVLGLYEKEIIDYICSQKKFNTLINLGAGDGYYPLGLLKANQISKAICFEMSEKGRNSILENSILNGASKRIEVFGKATGHTVSEVIGKEKKGRTLLICDIEGGEFEYFKEKEFFNTKDCMWIIELHDRVLGFNKKVREDLLACIPENLTVSIVKSKPVDWSNQKILEDLSDNDRALALSEGRKIIGEWLIISDNEK